MSRDVVIVSAARTAIGDFAGRLKDLPPTELGAHVIRAAISRAQIAANSIDHVVMGNVIHTEPKDMYLSRVSAVLAGVAHHTPALTVNRLCGSGLQAIVSAAQSILLGDARVAIAGGAESMSRALYSLPTARQGQRMGNAPVVDMMLGALTDPFERIHMGVTAENIAARYAIDRNTQDALALQSHQRAAHAIAQGYFSEQIAAIEIPSKTGAIRFDTDEHVNADITPEKLAALKPAFKKDGSVTAGNASSLNDGAAALVLMEASHAKALGLTPLARIVSYGHAGVDPSFMGLGPVPAVQNALKKAGLSVADMDVIESNEAFAVQSCAVARDLDFDPAKTNPNGGAVALGHPVGASGAIITVKAIYELMRTGKRYGLITMCIGGGQGIAMVIERA